MASIEKHTENPRWGLSNYEMDYSKEIFCTFPKKKLKKTKRWLLRIILLTETNELYNRSNFKVFLQFLSNMHIYKNQLTTTDLVRFTEEILNAKLHFLCSEWVIHFLLLHFDNFWKHILNENRPTHYY